MELSEIIKKSAERMQNVCVDIDRRFGTVCISSNGEEDIFMQGEDASDFIAQVDNLYEKAGDVTEDEAALCCAAPYCECIWN